MDLETFQNFVLNSKNKLFRFALKLLGDPDDANEIVQEVFVKVWNQRDSKIKNMEAWSMQITKNAALDRLRYLKKSHNNVDFSTVGLPSLEPSPHKKMEMEDNMNYIREIMVGLSENQRNVIHLRDIEGYSYQEIGHILELSLDQVKVNLFRARSKVKEQLLKINSHGL